MGGYMDIDIRELIQNSLDQVTAITNIRFIVAEEMPEIGTSGRIYLIASTGLMNDNIFNTYVWMDGEFKQLTNSPISLDLTGYVYKTDMAEITPEEVDEMFEHGESV
jgi:hypothetical protein